MEQVDTQMPGYETVVLLRNAIRDLGGDVTREEIQHWFVKTSNDVTVEEIEASIETAMLENLVITGSSKKHFSLAPEDTSFEIESVTKQMIADSFLRLGAGADYVDDPETETVSEEPTKVRAPPPHYKVGMPREKGMSRDTTNIPDQQTIDSKTRNRLPSDVRRYWTIESHEDGKGKKYSLTLTEDSSADNITQGISVGDPFIQSHSADRENIGVATAMRLSPVREKSSPHTVDRTGPQKESIRESGMSVLDYAKHINRGGEGYIEPRPNTNRRSAAPSRRATVMDDEMYQKRLASFSLPEIPEHPYERPGSVDTNTKQIIAETLFNFAQRDSITLLGHASGTKSEEYTEPEYEVKPVVTPSDPKRDFIPASNPLSRIDPEARTLLREHLLKQHQHNPLDTVDASTRLRLAETFNKLSHKPDRSADFPPTRRRKRGSFTDSAVEEDVRRLIGLSLRNLAHRGESHSNELVGIRNKYDLPNQRKKEWKRRDKRPLAKPSQFSTPDKSPPMYHRNPSTGHSTPSTGALSDSGLSSLLVKLDRYLDAHKVLPVEIERGLKERIGEIKSKREIQKLNELMRWQLSQLPPGLSQGHWKGFTSIRGSQMRIEQIEETLVNMNVTFDLKTSRGIPITVKLGYWMKQYRNHLQSGLEATALNRRLFHQSEHHLQKFDIHCFHSILHVRQGTFRSSEIAAFFGVICAVAFGIDSARWFGPIDSPGSRCCFF